MAALARPAFHEFETLYTAKANYAQLMQIYEETVAEYKPQTNSPGLRR